MLKCGKIHESRNLVAIGVQTKLQVKENQLTEVVKCSDYFDAKDDDEDDYNDYYYFHLFSPLI